MRELSGEPPLVEFRGLRVAYGARAAVEDASFSVERGEIAALVGASGSGKSQTALAALGLLPAGARASGQVLLAGENLLAARRARLDALRGNEIALVFQEPAAALDPFLSIGAQLCAVLRLKAGLGRKAARARALELLALARLPDPQAAFAAAPRQLSGGQLQRAAIAMAISCEPALVIADEPTAALDMGVAAQILDLLQDLRARLGLALILITHDLPLAARFCDAMHVMARGRIVESGPPRALFAREAGEAARLMRAEAAPRHAPAAPAGEAEPPLLEIEDLRVEALRPAGLMRRRAAPILRGVDLTLAPGRSLAVLGESGAGKSTLGRAALGLLPAGLKRSGLVRFRGFDVSGASQHALAPLRRDMQMVFQDPYGALSPRLSIGAIVAEGLAIHAPRLSARERDEAAAAALAEVGLDPARRGLPPRAFSGGQRQRVAIARAMILRPRLVVLDEPTSALDRAVRAEILRLLARLQAEHGLAYLVITHDFEAARALADEAAVMKDGVILERGPAAQALEAPSDPYAAGLVAAARRLGALERFPTG